MAEYKNTMLISPKKVKESGELSMNCDDTMIGASIRTAQKVYMVDILGAETIDRLQELVWNKIKGLPDNIDDPENVPYKTLLDDYLTDAMIYKTIIDLCIRSTFKIRNMGVIQNADTNVLSVNIDDVKFLQSYIETMYNHSLNRMADFICSNEGAFPQCKIKCGSCERASRFANINLYLDR